MSKITDPIADMLTRIRNAYRAKKSKVDIPSSKLKKQIAGIFLQNGYIKNLVEVEDNRQNLLRLYLEYDSRNKSVISGLVRISKSGLRIYAGGTDLKKMSRDIGIFVISTSRGLLTNKEALAQRIGGEVICKIW
jgi:small subunit ribosomal protein S8